MRRHLVPLLIPVLLTGALAGCGSDSDDEAPTVPVSDRPTATPTSPAPSTPTTPSESPSTSESATTSPSSPSSPSSPATSAPTNPPATTAPATAPTTSAPQPPAVDTDLRVAVTEFHVAFTTGDAPSAFELLSERCKDSVDMGAFGEESLALADKHGTTPRLTSYDADSGSDRATVSATFRAPRIVLRDEPWVRELGAWHRDVC